MMVAKKEGWVWAGPGAEKGGGALVQWRVDSAHTSAVGGTTATADGHGPTGRDREGAQ